MSGENNAGTYLLESASQLGFSHSCGLARLSNFLKYNYYGHIVGIVQQKQMWVLDNFISLKFLWMLQERFAATVFRHLSLNNL
jgi:hypothetical protein